MKSLIARIFGADRRFSKLEASILSHVKGNLDQRAADLWGQQVEAINKIQRLPGGVEVNFYRMRHGKPTFDEAIAFPNKTQELLVAQVSVSVHGLSYALSAEIWTVNGFLFSIEYDREADYFEEVLSMEPPVEAKFRCTVVSNIMAKAP